MGSTGKKSSSNTSNTSTTATPSTAMGMTGGGVSAISTQPVNQNNPAVAAQVPTTQNTPVNPQALSAMSKMSDDELAALVNAAKKAQMPNFLADASDITQKVVFQAGLNEKPQVLDQSEFNQFLTDNNISSRAILARSVNGANYTNQQGYAVHYTPQDVVDLMKYSKLNYIGGKHGGQSYGAGTYFDMNGGGNTGYGSGATAQAVLNPATAKVISYSDLSRKAQAFATSHPKFANAVGRYNNKTMSVYALAMGYNVITSAGNNAVNSPKNRGDYYNVIDRSALVYLK